ncbi:MAG: glycosyltransferase family 2 protein [Actinomycetota bacterium]
MERREADPFAKREVIETVSVIIPTLNEAKNLEHVFARLPQWIDELIIVDGGSTDDTVEMVRQLRPDAKIIGQDRSGKGNALVCGFRAATSDIIVMIDADGSTDAAEIPRYVAALRSGADYAKGSRFVTGGGSSDITLFRSLGNKVLCAIVNVMFDCNYSDLCYGYNAFYRRHLADLGINSTGFEVETLMNIRAARRGLRVIEVPSYEAERLHGTSNLNAVRDGIRVLRTIMSERISVS